MHVIMITPSLPPLPSGGAELQALKLAARLKTKGVSVTFLTPGKGSEKGPSTLQEMPVHRLYSPFSRVFEFLSGHRRSAGRPGTVIEYDDKKQVVDRITRKAGWPTVVYYNIFYWNCLLFLWPRRNKFDIIHAHTMEWSAIVAARLGRALKKPVLIKDSTMNGFASLARFPRGSHLQKMIVANAHFIAMTNAIRNNLLNAGIPAEKISHIPNGIETGAAETSASTAAAEASTSIAGTSRVLFVGNLYQQPAKGVDILLKAWSLVTRRHPGILLDIIGDGDLPAYREYTRQLGIYDTVHFHGKQTELRGYYESAALFVLPSRREGMSNALMEAMLHALPCIATDISGNQDLIQSGVNGLLVPPADAAALAEAIDHLLAHPDIARQMGRKARETIVSGLDIDKIATQYYSLYQGLL